MKKDFFKVCVLFSMAILVWGTVPLVNAQEKAKQQVPAKEAKESAPFSVKRLVVGTGMENREPIGVAETFPASVEKVYCFLEATNIAENMEATFVWFNGDKELSRFTAPVKQGPRWRTHVEKNLRGLKGNWKVELRDSGDRILKEVKFKVE